MKKIYLFNNYKKVMSPEEIFSPFSLWIVNLCLKSYTLCIYFILYLHHVWLWIRIHKAPDYVSNTDPFPQYCTIYVFYILLLDFADQLSSFWLCPDYILIYICILYGCLTDFFPHRKNRYGITLCVFMYQTVAIATSI